MPCRNYDLFLLVFIAIVNFVPLQGVSPRENLPIFCRGLPSVLLWTTKKRSRDSREKEDVEESEEEDEN